MIYYVIVDREKLENLNCRNISKNRKEIGQGKNEQSFYVIFKTCIRTSIDKRHRTSTKVAGKRIPVRQNQIKHHILFVSEGGRS